MMTEQTEDDTRLLEFFRRAVRHVVEQGRAAQINGSCIYYGDAGGLCCVIGGALDMEVAKTLEKRFRGESLTLHVTNCLNVFVCAEIGVTCNAENLKFLSGLQGCHDMSVFDKSFVEDFLRKIAKLAKEYDIPFDRTEYLKGAGA